jgi:hypothetical protein
VIPDPEKPVEPDEPVLPEERLGLEPADPEEYRVADTDPEAVVDEAGLVVPPLGADDDYPRVEDVEEDRA